MTVYLLLAIALFAGILFGFYAGWMCRSQILSDEGVRTGKVRISGRIYWRCPPPERRKLRVPAHGVPVDYAVEEYRGA